MKIGERIEIETFEPRIIPITIPERVEAPAETPAVEEPEAIPVPNWPAPVKVPVQP